MTDSKEIKTEPTSNESVATPVLPSKTVARKSGGVSWVIIGLIIIIITSLVLGGSYFTFLRTSLKELKYTSYQVSKLQAMLVQLQTMPSHNVAIKDNKLLAELEQKIPTSGSISSLLEDISAQVEYSGLTLMNFEEKNQEIKDTLIIIPVELTLTGSYENLLKFINSFADFNRLITIDGIHLTTFSTVQENVILSITLQLTAYKGQEMH